MKRNQIIGITFLLLGIILNPWVLVNFIGTDGKIEDPFSVRVMTSLVVSVILLIIGILAVFNQLNFSFKNALLSFFTFIFIILLMEGGLRLFFYLQQKSNPSAREYAALLGWQTSENAIIDMTDPVYGKVQYSTTKYGFRMFGDPASKKRKILILGDSYTQAYQISEGGTYYDYLQEHVDAIELFVYGCGGYGSLQEYLILDRYWDSIQPDLVLWQFCSNDLINNSHTLESQSFRNNNLMTRPYLVDGEIEMLFPKRDQGLTANLIQASYLLRFINTRINILKAESDAPTIEDQLKEGDPVFEAARSTTMEILKMVKTRIEGTPVLTFSVDEKWESVYREASEELGFTYIDGIPQKIAAAKKAGQKVDGAPYDDHWNEKGHAMAGEVLADFLSGYFHD